MNKVLIGLVILLAAGGMGYISINNSLVAKDEACELAAKEIDNQLQRRYEFLPNYIAMVSKAVKVEAGIMDKFAEARKMVAGAGTMGEKAAAEGEIRSVLSRLMVVVESYPNLKTSETMLHGQDELAGTENRLATARMRYNEAVNDYNVAIKKFPGSLFGRRPRDYFNPPVARENLNKVPDVKKMLDE